MSQLLPALQREALSPVVTVVVLGGDEGQWSAEALAQDAQNTIRQRGWSSQVNVASSRTGAALSKLQQPPPASSSTSSICTTVALMPLVRLRGGCSLTLARRVHAAGTAAPTSTQMLFAATAAVGRVLTQVVMVDESSTAAPHIVPPDAAALAIAVVAALRSPPSHSSHTATVDVSPPNPSPANRLLRWYATLATTLLTPPPPLSSPPSTLLASPSSSPSSSAAVPPSPPSKEQQTEEQLERTVAACEMAAAAFPRAAADCRHLLTSSSSSSSSSGGGGGHEAPVDGLREGRAAASWSERLEAEVQSKHARAHAEKVVSLAWANRLMVPLTDASGESALWTTPLVTVVITTFNRASMLREAIQSIYLQVR
jgi:hypothetical protein